MLSEVPSHGLLPAPKRIEQLPTKAVRMMSWLHPEEIGIILVVALTALSALCQAVALQKSASAAEIIGDCKSKYVSSHRCTACENSGALLHAAQLELPLTLPYWRSSSNMSYQKQRVKAVRQTVVRSGTFENA